MNQDLATGLIILICIKNMKKVIRLTETDLARIVKRTINEMEDEDFMRGADKNWGDREEHKTMRGRFFDKEDQEDEEWGETDKGEEELQDLIEEARDILENEFGYTLHDINLMSEWDMVDILYDEGYQDIASAMEELLDQEGFDDLDADQPYDAIGGLSPMDIKRKFDDIIKK